MSNRRSLKTISGNTRYLLMERSFHSPMIARRQSRHPVSDRGPGDVPLKHVGSSSVRRFVLQGGEKPSHGQHRDATLAQDCGNVRCRLEVIISAHDCVRAAVERGLDHDVVVGIAAEVYRTGDWHDRGTLTQQRHQTRWAMSAGVTPERCAKRGRASTNATSVSNGSLVTSVNCCR